MSKFDEIMPESEKVLCAWAKAQDYVDGGRIYRRMGGPVGRDDKRGLLMGAVFPVFKRKIIFPVGALEYSLNENRDMIVVKTDEDLQKAIQFGDYSVRLDAYLGGRLNGWSQGGVEEARLNRNSDEVFTIISDAKNADSTIRSAKGDDPRIDLSGNPRAMITNVIQYIEERIRRERR